MQAEAASVFAELIALSDAIPSRSVDDPVGDCA
jgi:hypothetical protein